MTSRRTVDLFRPAEGALLDLDSLKAIAEAPERILEAWQRVTWPGAGSLVLEGLELRGTWSSTGPPGTVTVASGAPGIAVSPGVAMLTDRNGRRQVIAIEEEQTVKWPPSVGPNMRGVLVLDPQVEGADDAEGLNLARERLYPRLAFGRPDQENQRTLVVLASALGNGRDWATDVRRTWQPEHHQVRRLLEVIADLELKVWDANPEGDVWARSVLGKQWTRYQTVAASALQAARMQLETHAMTTLQRVRLLRTLRRQLQGSVERAAQDLVQAIGTADVSGPYRDVLSDGPVSV